MRVAVVGGTGPFGRALARQLARAGHDVVVGSREEARAQEVAEELGAFLERRPPRFAAP